MCCVLDESGTDGAKCCRKMVSGGKSVVAIRSLLHEALIMPVLLYGSKAVIWREIYV